MSDIPKNECYCFPTSMLFEKYSFDQLAEKQELFGEFSINIPGGDWTVVPYIRNTDGTKIEPIDYYKPTTVVVS